MVSGEVTVVNESGLHLRPAGVLTQTSIKYKSNIYLYKREKGLFKQPKWYKGNSDKWPSEKGCY